VTRPENFGSHRRVKKCPTLLPSLPYNDRLVPSSSHRSSLSPNLFLLPKSTDGELPRLGALQLRPAAASVASWLAPAEGTGKESMQDLEAGKARRNRRLASKQELETGKNAGA
jgi:hypothetical protein